MDNTKQLEEIGRMYIEKEKEKMRSKHQQHQEPHAFDSMPVDSTIEEMLEHPHYHTESAYEAGMQDGRKQGFRRGVKGNGKFSRYRGYISGAPRHFNGGNPAYMGAYPTRAYSAYDEMDEYDQEGRQEQQFNIGASVSPEMMEAVKEGLMNQGGQSMSYGNTELSNLRAELGAIKGQMEAGKLDMISARQSVLGAYNAYAPVVGGGTAIYWIAAILGFALLIWIVKHINGRDGHGHGGYDGGHGHSHIGTKAMIDTCGLVTWKDFVVNKIATNTIEEIRSEVDRNDRFVNVREDNKDNVVVKEQFLVNGEILRALVNLRDIKANRKIAEFVTCPETNCHPSPRKHKGCGCNEEGFGFNFGDDNGFDLSSLGNFK